MKKCLLLLFSGFVLSTNAQITLYGMTQSGGNRHNYGTIFETTTGGNLTTVVKFDSANGRGPTSSLIQANDGNLYGVTLQGGFDDSCVAFRYSLSGVTVLFDFDSAGFDDPYGSMIQAKDGNLYGMTADGAGSKQYGSIYKTTLSGGLIDLHDFNGTSDGGLPQGALLQATDGNFYGECSGGSAQGTLFRCTPLGVFTTLVTFNGVNGGLAFGSLIQATDSNLYGMTEVGGAYNDGIIFKCSLTGSITTIHSFNDTDGGLPTGTLVQGTDGNLYGMTPYGGDSNSGVVFKCTTSGNYQVLDRFHGTNGSLPFGSLIQASDGNFYGMTTHGGAYKKGTLFTLGTGNSFTILVNFNDSNGANPYYTSLLEVTGALGINTIKSSEPITIFPNPFSNSTTIAVNTEGMHYIELDDITGRKIESLEFIGKQYKLSAQGLAKGMYFIRVFDNQNALVCTSKIMVE